MELGIVLLVTSMALFVALLTVILPKLFLKVKFRVKEPTDRGIKRYIYNGKRCVVYETGNQINKYIKNYLLLEGDNCKILRCKTANRIVYLDYDVVVFDRYDKVVGVINVKENMVSGNFTRRVELPEETSYVRIILRKANNISLKKKKEKPIAYISKGKIFLYSLAAMVVTVLEVFALKVACAYAFGEVFRESFVRSGYGIIMGFILAIATGIIATITVSASIKRYGKR